MRKLIFLFVGLMLLSVPSFPQSSAEFESASAAVKNMGLGWNLGNTLDANSNDTLHMWIEYYNKGSKRTTSVYETAWGQPVTKPELFRMLKDAGFNAVRVPVTWYPHMEAKFDNLKYYSSDKICWYPSRDDLGTKIDAKWMARVHQVVDYVLDAGLYCIINVHHDTGAMSSAWLIADEDCYEREHARYEAIWTQIATEFRDYDEHLLFEGYNEMLDRNRSWCYASMNSNSEQYDSKVAESAYRAINKYAQSFVDAVRATGGNNLTRNLIVSTYAAASGFDNWSSHLMDPLNKLDKPKDYAPGHIIAELHAYIDVHGWGTAKLQKIQDWMKSVKTALVTRKQMPVIIGEWGTSDVDDPDSAIPREDKLKYAEAFVRTAKRNGFATFYWMGLSDRSARSVPKWSEEDLKDALVKGYYGGPYNAVEMVEDDGESEGPYYDLYGRPAEEHLLPGIYIHNGQKVLIEK